MLEQPCNGSPPSLERTSSGSANRELRQLLTARLGRDDTCSEPPINVAGPVPNETG